MKSLKGKRKVGPKKIGEDREDVGEEGRIQGGRIGLHIWGWDFLLIMAYFKHMKSYRK